MKNKNLVLSLENDIKRIYENIVNDSVLNNLYKLKQYILEYSIPYYQVNIETKEIITIYPKYIQIRLNEIDKSIKKRLNKLNN